MGFACSGFLKRRFWVFEAMLAFASAYNRRTAQRASISRATSGVSPCFDISLEPQRSTFMSLSKNGNIEVCKAVSTQLT